MNRTLKKQNSRTRNLKNRKESVQQIESKKSQDRQKAIKQSKKNEKLKIYAHQSQNIKTQQPESSQSLPYVKKACQRRQLKKMSNWMNSVKGSPVFDRETNDSNYQTQNQQYRQVKINNGLGDILGFTKKSINEKQKTMPIQNRSLTSETNNLIKEIIARSRSRKQLGYGNKLNSDLANNTASFKRAFSQQRQQRSEEKSEGKNIALLEHQQNNKGIKSCKQINLFRINSKKNLILDRTQQTKKLSLSKSSALTENFSQSSKASVYTSLKQNLARPYLLSKKNSTLQIKENVNNTNTTNTNLKTMDFIDLPDEISEIKELQLSDRNSSQNSFSIPEINCSIICQNQESNDRSSFLNSTAKKIFGKIAKQKSIVDDKINYETQSNATKGALPPAQLKKLFEQKNRKKILEVDKLRKKFPNDFFKV